MLALFKHYREHLQLNGGKLDSVIELLEVTSSIVDFFCNTHMRLSNFSEAPVTNFLKCLDFFHDWEKEFSSPKEKIKHLITKETHEDIDVYIWFCQSSKGGTKT